MRLDHIREFVYLAKELSFVETAKAFYIAQSALSKHIAALEKELGGALFVRDSHQVYLTNTGQLFFEGMSEVLAKYDATVSEVKKTLDGFNSTLRIGYLYEATKDFFLPACRELSKKNSDLGIETRAFEVEEVTAALKRESIEVGITVLPPDKEYLEYRTHKLRQEKYCVVVLKTNRLSKRQSITTKDVAGMDVLFPSPYAFPELSAYLHRKLADTAFEHNAVETAHDSKAIMPFLTMYNGAALIIEHSIPTLEEGCKILELEDVDLSVNLSAVWKKKRESSAIQSFIACIDDQLAASTEL